MQVRAGVLADVEAHARSAAPLECCGLLLGTSDRIVEAVPARNVAESATRYLVEPADHFAAIRRGRNCGLDVIGGYHSHPAGPQIPSPRDIAESPGPEFLHLLAARGPDGTEATLEDNLVLVRRVLA